MVLYNILNNIFYCCNLFVLFLFNWIFTYIFLEPFTEYQIHVVAKCGNHIKSESSDTIMQYTDIDGPGPPIIINATCVPGTNGTSIFLQWTKPQLFYKSVDEYIIYVSYDTDFVKKFNFSLPKDSNNINVCKVLIFK